MKADIVNIPTEADAGFKLTADVLIKVLASVKKPWLYISGPTVSPTGLLYSNKEMEDILSVSATFGARVLIDTSFSGLEYNIDSRGAWNLEPTLTKLSSLVSSPSCVSLFGDLSLEMLSGGLSFAFLAIDQSLFSKTANVFAGLKRPHSTVRYAVKKLLAQAEEEAGQITEFVAEHKRILKHRSQRLRETLQKCGWEVLPSRGGVSMVAKPCGYIGKHVKFEDSDGQKIELVDDSTIREAILATTGLCINTGSRTGIPGYCRFTIALQDSEFEQALDCITKFNDLVV
ncbi:Methionine S-methyltransferase [Bienertia sinuspersici]